MRYRMKAKLMSIGDDYWIEDDAGNKAFLVNGKAMRVRDTWIMEDPKGNQVAEIKERKFTVRDKMKIDLGSRSATVTKHKLGFRDHYKVEIDGGDELKVHGDFVDHEFEIERKGDKVAEISKKWFRIRDTYGVEVGPREDPVLILAVTVAVDSMSTIID